MSSRQKRGQCGAVRASASIRALYTTLAVDSGSFFPCTQQDRTHPLAFGMHFQIVASVRMVFMVFRIEFQRLVGIRDRIPNLGLGGRVVDSGSRAPATGPRVC